MFCAFASTASTESVGRITSSNMAKLIIRDAFPNANGMKKVHKQSSLTPALQLLALTNQHNLGSEQIAAGRATRAAMASSLARANYAGTAWF